MIDFGPAHHQPSPDDVDLGASVEPDASVDLDALGDEIARLSAHIHAATYRLLCLIRTFDENEGWGGGFQSCAHWLSWRTGLSLGPAREKVRVARALVRLPLLSERMRSGQFSYSKVRALTRVATRENEAELIGFAEHGTVAHVERLVRGWRQIDRQEDLAEGKLRYATRSLSVFPDDSGMYVVRGRLDPEVGSLLMKALEVAGDALYETDPDATATQRRADALAEILKGESGGGPGTQAAVHAVIQITHDGTQTEEGVHVPAETSDRMTCDAEVTVVRREATSGPDSRPDSGAGTSGSVLDVGRRRRTVSGRMRRALETRDQGRCRFPGCEARRCDAHHVTHWSRGGETKLDNLVLLCRFHHRAVHEGGFGVVVQTGGSVTFSDPDGRELPECPGMSVDPALPTDPALGSDLARWHGQTNLGPDTCGSRWTGGPVDCGWALQWLRRPGGFSTPDQGEPPAAR